MVLTLSFVPPAVRAETAASSYIGIGLSAPFHRHYVSALDPAYSEAAYSISSSAGYRHYPAERIGLAAELSYLHPWARVVRTDDTSETTGRADHAAWLGLRGALSASARWYFDVPGSRHLRFFAYLDGGLQLVYYNREAENIFEERSFQSSRLSVVPTARPGVLFELPNSLFFGVDVSLGASLVERERVDRRYLEDISYNSFFRGLFVSPGLSVGVSY